MFAGSTDQALVVFFGGLIMFEILAFVSMICVVPKHLGRFP